MRHQIGTVKAVDGVSFSVDRGQTVALVGESGCGKSTTARAVLQLLPPTAGSIRFEGEELTKADTDRLRQLRREMQIVFQDPYASLNPRMTVRNILTEPFKIHGIDPGDRVAELLRGAAADPVVLARPDDVARVAYTSGSTGRPKGCMQTYKALSAHWSWDAENWCADTVELARCTSRYLLFGTLSSAVVQDHLALCLLSGGTAVIPRLPAPGEGPLFPGVFGRLRATATIMNVPRLYQMLDAVRTAEFDMSTVAAIMVAGSPLPAHRLAEAVELLGPVVYSSYGLTETGGLTALTPTDIAHGVLASVGRPLPSVEVDIRDGEILVRTPYQMCGYFDEPELTAEVLTPDGWARTRDLGRLEGGYLYLTGRAREVIIVDALPVYAGPIERLLAAQEDVDQAYVIGAPSDLRGEAVHAFVVPRPGRSLDHAALRQAVRAELGELSVPETITPLSEVPVAVSGKPDKAALLGLLQGQPA